MNIFFGMSGIATWMTSRGLVYIWVLHPQLFFVTSWTGSAVKMRVERIFALNEYNTHIFLLEEPFTLTDEAAAVAGADAGVKQADTDAMTL